MSSFYVTDKTGEREFARMSIIAAIKHKNERYEVVGAVDTLPSLSYFGEHMVWCGNFTRSAPTMKERYITKMSAVKDVIHDMLMSPSEVARAYLEFRFPKQLRAKKEQIEHWQPRRHQPILAFPGKYRNMVYLDLKSAYWSILQVIGYDVEYFPDMLVRGQSVSDFPYPDNKIARNCLVSMGLPTPTFVWHKGKIKEIVTKKNINIGLWTAVQDILAAIANEMWNCGAVYINTDGYIIPEANEQLAINIIREWGLHAEIKHRGHCTVYGVGGYTIGSHICKFGHRLNVATIDVNPVDVLFLKREFSWLASKYPPAYNVKP